jgi:hypothetical protein
MGHEYENATGVNATGAGASNGNGYANRFKNYWTSRNMPQKIGLGYGAGMVANAPFVMNNNAHANWQQQHPVMSWFGQNFGGMPKYNPKSFLMPSFMQG